MKRYDESTVMYLENLFRFVLGAQHNWLTLLSNKNFQTTTNNKVSEFLTKMIIATKLLKKDFRTMNE